jgi:hypothetical protein
MKKLLVDFLIKEPEGIDFIIQSQPLTDGERKEISEFIEHNRQENKSKVRTSIVKKISKQTI